MKRHRAWALVIAFAIAGGFWAWLKCGTSGFSALQEPTAMEAVVARSLRGIAMPQSARTMPNPVPSDAQVLADGRAHWADHCALCHANDGSGDTEMSRHMYPRAPDMRLPITQNKTDGELFYLIENGIRLSGMPGWHVDGREVESWKLVHFIRHLPQVSAEERLEMERMNPKGSEDRNEERKEEEFLNGGTAPQLHKAHH